jgi:low temperature requirement protein LtrA
VVALKNYLGFFTLLWFTWLETSLLDVRFASDSFFDRVCKAISFGVMTGFAIVGSLYDTTDVEEDLKAFRAMSFILMVSRLALIAQYAVVLWYVKGYRNTLVPLLSTMGTLFVSALVFLGTFWGFRSVRSASEDGRATIQHPDTYLAWYIVVVCEAAAIIVISCVWRVVSFKRTHLVERIGLLTLIIMGEGIIGMTKSVSSILKFSASVTSGDIGVVAAAVLLIVRVQALLSIK